MQLHMTRWFYIREEFNFGVTPRVEEIVISIDVLEEKERTNDIDKDDSNKETKWCIW